ncbi:reticulon-4 receptor-like [Spea bombifrons]|uniref:reticulon-4 receptor-like n=1 Tax=Spea bombifrons TaxID=233779 RepID=UPI00234A8EE9|nr:reticulon-4 receptor-like [Spea bombifrons]
MQGTKLLFLVACCISFRFKVEGCPEACICYDEPKITISCQQQRLTVIPSYIPIQTQRIFLHNNKITLIRSTSFTSCQNLTILWIHSNNISYIESGSFHGLNKLEELDMSDNFNLKTISPLTFRGLVHLHTLHLNRCGLQDLPPGIFQGLFSLQYLYLHDNNLHFLPDDTFVDLGNLTFLFLHGNKLNSLSENVFNGLINLDRLLVHQNRLTFVHRRTFHDLKKVTTLYLFNNNLTVLKGEILSPLVSLQYLRLNGNQWICDCRAKSLWNWLKQFKGSSSELECYIPLNLAGSDLKKLKIIDLDGCTNTSFIQMRTGLFTAKSGHGKQTDAETFLDLDEMADDCCQPVNKPSFTGTNAKTGPSSHTSRVSPNIPVKDKENISKTKMVGNVDNRKNRTHKQINDSPFGTFTSKTDSSLTKLKQNNVFESVEPSTVPNKKKNPCLKKVKSKSQCRMYQPGTNSALLITANLLFITLFSILPIYS